MILIFSASSLHASECKLTGILSGEEKIQTSFAAGTLEECRKLAASTGENKFFGLLAKEQELLETTLIFREEDGSKKDTVDFKEDEDSYSSDG